MDIAIFISATQLFTGQQYDMISINFGFHENYILKEKQNKSIALVWFKQ